MRPLLPLGLIGAVLWCTSGAFGILSRPPQLECLPDALRLHFLPEGYPFIGHVYVKGFFYSSRCHLDYTQFSMAEPFFFHIPYRSDCQVRRERVQNPRGISYTVTVIVQHHRLFVTSVDKAYSVSCFYRDTQTRLEQSVEIGDLTTQVITQSDGTPACIYNVLQGSINGPVAKYANIGDTLIHKWSCDSPEMGILVHSCFVRDGIGNEFALLNERGCPTDPTLVVPISYSDDRSTAFAPISAFKFADQMIVYFSCQITLCARSLNGCEGITPPACQFMPLPSDFGGAPIQVTDTSTSSTATPPTESTTPSPIEFGSSTTPPAAADLPVPDTELNVDERPVTRSFPDLTNSAPRTTLAPPSSSLTAPTAATPEVTGGTEERYNGSGMPSSMPQGDHTQNTDNGFLYRGSGVNPYGPPPTTTTTVVPTQPTPEPLGPDLFQQGYAAARHARAANASAPAPTRITVGVTADQLIVFTKDEKADAGSSEGEELVSNEAATAAAPEGESAVTCTNANASQSLVWVAAWAATLAGGLALLIAQRHFYQRQLHRLSRSSSSESVELKL